RATSVAAPSPTMRPIVTSGRGAAPDSTSRAFIEAARSRRESTSVPSRSNTIKRCDRGKAALSCQCSAFSHSFVGADLGRPCRAEQAPPLRAVLRERGRRFPHGDADDGQSFSRGAIENQPGDSFDGRVAVEQINRLAELLK